METYYSKKEYNDMKKLLEKKIQMLEKQNKKLMDKIQKQNEFIALITQ
jgi:prefoldin subunit 5